MEAALRGGAAKLCRVWMVARRDGVTLGFTDHDRDLVVMGVVCRAQSGFTQGAVVAELGVSGEGNAAVQGVLAGDAIRAEDVAAGLYDEAALKTYVVDWTAPDDAVLVGVGYLARLECRGGMVDGEGTFVAHVEGLAGRLQRVIGRRFGFLCDAALGDARCGLSADAIAGRTCDKRYATCLGTFGNSVNFRGFPDLPGEDFLTVYPRSGDVMDGQSRKQGAGR